MNWFSELFVQQTFTQAIIVLSLICAIGVALGHLKFKGISLGVTFVFFTGIIARHFGLMINQEMLTLAQNFGLILFIYSLGLQVGPGFFATFKKGGVKLNISAIALMVAGTVMMLAIHWVSRVSLGDCMGLFAGAVTNTPMLGAAQQALLQVYPDSIGDANNMAMACAIGYPFGLVGMILCVVIHMLCLSSMWNSRRTSLLATIATARRIRKG